ncbi:TPA: hypothetical protein EYP38_05250 [Candidatus Micrarchaeota archaeon]|nr:hypothetical protein [Candidatus Micrarchaeota archaeon]
MRGQSAVEYVVTYGWAILALVIVVGVLLSSGILSPTYLISDECNAGTNLPCAFALFNEGGATQLSMEIHNGFPYQIHVERVNVTMPETGEVFVMEALPGDGYVDSGESLAVRGHFEGGELSEETYKRFTLGIVYASCARELLDPGDVCSDSYHTISGRLAGRVFASE